MAEATFTPLLNNNPVLKAKNSAGLKKCFQALVDRKQVNLDMGVLSLMLKYELQVDLDSLNPKLAAVLPYMLIFYIRNWPGWQKSKEYYSGKLNYREWFLKFRQYIIIRLNYLIQHGYSTVLTNIAKEQEDELKKNQNNMLDKGTQTERSEPIAVAPFAISIQCHPKMLSSLVFSDTDGDIILSQHQEHQWFPITIADLVNWPHVGIEFVSSEFSFKRNNKSEYRRYVNFINCDLDKNTTQFVENIEIVNPSIERQCYTLHFLLKYVQQYNEILQKIPNISKSKLLAIKVFMEAVLTDVYEIGTLLGQKDPDISIATNTSILFNIGQCSFVRNKKLGKSNWPRAINDKEVGYCETYIPKVELLIDFFKGVQDTSTSNTTFVHLNFMNNMIQSNSDLVSSFEPLLMFKCLFCAIIYDKYENLIKHFQSTHGMEPGFLCPKCCKVLSINTLSQFRWKHICEKRTDP